MVNIATLLIVGVIVALVLQSKGQIPFWVTPPPRPGCFTVPTDLNAAIAALRADFERRAGVSVVSHEMEPIEFPDSGGPCHEAGQMYAQVITPGFRVTFRTRVAGKDGVYLLAGGRALFSGFTGSIPTTS